MGGLWAPGALQTLRINDLSYRGRFLLPPGPSRHSKPMISMPREFRKPMPRAVLEEGLRGPYAHRRGFRDRTGPSSRLCPPIRRTTHVLVGALFQGCGRPKHRATRGCAEALRVCDRLPEKTRVPVQQVPGALKSRGYPATVESIKNNTRHFGRTF
jgi:hypothetical protein